MRGLGGQGMPFVEVDGLEIHYEMEGTGHPLIILHGLGNNSQSWKNQLDGLKSNFTVIAWDAPGYGKSSDPKEEYRGFDQFADVLKGFIDKLNYQKVYLLGHSMGSAIAIDFCNRYTEMVAKLIIADPTRGSAGGTKVENESKLQTRINNINKLDPKELAKQRVPNLLAPNAKEEIIKEAERIMSQVRPLGYRSVAYSLYNLNNMDILPKISVPTLIICGEMDKATPVSESQIFHDQIPGSKFVIIPNTGHLCYQEDPESFNNVVVDFLE